MHVPALPGVVTEGGTLEQALAMAREAIALHLEGLREDGLEIPIERPARRRHAVRIAVEVNPLAESLRRIQAPLCARTEE